VATIVAAILAPLITAVLAWGVGSLITDRWDEMKGRRDLDLLAVSEFYVSYGEYVAVWRLWSARKRYEDTAHPPGDVQWLLLSRASDVESRLEALLIRCTTERSLSQNQQEQLACFREASQQLRESIRSDSALNWFSSGGESSREYRGYQAFKGLSASFAHMLQQPRPRVRLLRGRTTAGLPTVKESRDAWRYVSSGAHKDQWLERAESCL
jgi:hypothetical protein